MGKGEVDQQADLLTCAPVVTHVRAGGLTDSD